LIQNNAGGGVQAPAGSLLKSLGGNDISNNPATGVAIDHLSSAHFFAADNLAGNTGSNLSCDATSIVYGDVGNSANVSCKNVEKTKGPPHAPVRRPVTYRQAQREVSQASISARSIAPSGPCAERSLRARNASVRARPRSRLKRKLEEAGARRRPRRMSL
jgi:hypothetical protein